MTAEEEAVFKQAGLRMGGMIEKQFTFSDTPLQLPPLSAFFSAPAFADEPMLRFKAQLIATKTKLDGVDLAAWDKQVKLTNVVVNL